MVMSLNLTKARLTKANLYGEPAAGSGLGTVTSVGGGNGIVPTPNPIVDGGVLDLGTLTSDWNAGNYRIESQNSVAVYNALEIGAVADGMTNVSPVVQAIVNDASLTGQKAAVIYFPPGYYRFEDPIDLTDQNGTIGIGGLATGLCSLTIQGSGTNLYGMQPATVFIGDTAATSDVLFDCIGHANLTFRDFAVMCTWDDAGTGTFPLTPIPNRSTIAFLLGRSTTSIYSEFVRFDNVVIFMKDEAVGVNNGLGSIGIHNLGSEHGQMINCRITANTTTWNSRLASDPTGLTPPFGTLASGSMSIFDFRNCVFQSETLVTYPTKIAVNCLGLNFDGCAWIHSGIATACVGLYGNQSGDFIDDIRFRNCYVEGYQRFVSTKGLISRLSIDGYMISDATVTDYIQLDGTALFTEIHGLDFDMLLYDSGTTTTTSLFTNPGAAKVYGLRAKTYAKQTVNCNTILVNGTIVNAASTTLTPAVLAGSNLTVFNLNDESHLGLAGFNTTAPTRQIDLNGTQRFRGIAAPAVSEVNSGTIYFDSGLNKYRVSMNGGAYVDLVGSAGVTGSGVANKLTYWTAATNLTDEPKVTLGGTYTLGVDGDIDQTTGSVLRVNAETVFKSDAANGVTAVGRGLNSSLGISATVVGDGACAAVVTGDENTAIGLRCAETLTAGNRNNAVGVLALGQTTTGNDNVAVGRDSGITNTTGSHNVFIGNAADAGAGNLDNAVAIGYAASVAASDSMALGNASMKVGIRTSTPGQAMDVNGAVATRQLILTLVNDLNSDIALTETSWVRIEGPSAVFSVGGFTGGTDGRLLTIRNTVAFQMTIVHQDASSAAANQIITPTGGNVNCSVANFAYDDTDDMWVLISYH